MNNIKYIKVTFILLIIFILFSPYTAIATFYSWSNSLPVLPVSATNSASANANTLNLDCGSCILIEQNSGQILYSSNEHEQLRPASVTKIMSLLLIMEAVDSGKITLDTKIPCSENASKMGGSQIWLDTTETLSVNDMLKAICVVSANDCVVALSEYLGGTEEGFVQMMNSKAKELGMNDTCFKNCHGLDEDDHVTSSYDIALMSRELLTKHPTITQYTTIWTDSLRDGKSALSNTNKLVRNYSGCTGLKTGSTSTALYNLSASATRDGLSLIAVVLKAPTSALRFQNAMSLLDYGFNNYTYKAFGSVNAPLKDITVSKGITSNVNAVYETSPSFLVKKGEEANISYEISIPDSVQAPVTKGQILGTVTYSSGNTQLMSVNLIADNSVEKIDLLNMSAHIFNKWFSLLRV